mmetsp:Transcript_15846/g.20822  ORF Transcript_15846/g.20822 Transcript_15846/m.20822 type:complete len:191 (+) Transcript_15846:122-694(+)
MSKMMSSTFPKRLVGKRVAYFCDYSFEDIEVIYPKMRLEEEGATVFIVGSHAAGQQYKGKHGIPMKSDICVKDLDFTTIDAIVIPGGFSPDYMRRSTNMLEAITQFVQVGKPVAAVCHGPWMFCSARNKADNKPVINGYKCTSFFAIKDDLINAGGIWIDEPVVVDRNIITSRIPTDLIAFSQAIITALL